MGILSSHSIVNALCTLRISYRNICRSHSLQKQEQSDVRAAVARLYPVCVVGFFGDILYLHGDCQDRQHGERAHWHRKVWLH